MTNTIFLTLFLLFHSTLIFANVGQLKELLVEKACIQQLASHVNSYKLIHNDHFKKESKNSIFSLFNTLTEYHSKHLDYLLEFKKAHFQRNMSSEKAERILNKLSGLQTEYLERATNISRKDQLFLEKINALENKIYDLENKVKLIERGCPNNEKSTTLSIIKDIEAWKTSLAKMRSYVIAAARKRANVFSILLEAVKMELKKIIQNDTLSKLSGKSSKIAAILEGGELQDEIMRWFYNLSKGGICDSMVFKYNQYESPLKCLRIHYEQTLKYDVQIDGLNLSEELAAMLKSQLKMYKDSIKKALDDLEAKGYQGVFSEQKFYVNAYFDIAHTLSQSCRDAISQYQMKSKNVTSLEQFRIVEPLYIKVVDSCVIVR